MNKVNLKIFLFCLFGVALQANAATVSREFSGNDCSGYFGTGFDSCAVFVFSDDKKIELSPVIAKFNEGFSLSDANGTLFPSVDGTEFNFSNTSSGNKTGTWDYTPGVDDPAVRYWSAKAGPKFLLFWEVADAAVQTGGACDVPDVYTLNCLDIALAVDTGDWTTPDNKSLSHITFYDTAVVPLPAAAWLFGSGLGLLGWMRRKPA